MGKHVLAQSLLVTEGADGLPPGHSHHDHYQQHWRIVECSWRLPLEFTDTPTAIFKEQNPPASFAAPPLLPCITELQCFLVTWSLLLTLLQFQGAYSNGCVVAVCVKHD